MNCHEDMLSLHMYEFFREKNILEKRLQFMQICYNYEVERLLHTYRTFVISFHFYKMKKR